MKVPGWSVLGSAVALALSAVLPAAAAAPRSPSSGAAPGAGETQLVLPPPVSDRIARARRSLAPSNMRKLELLARSCAPHIASGVPFPTLRQRAEAGVSDAFSAVAGMDVAEAALLVLAMATKDMDDDLRMIMAETKALNAAKQQLREQIGQLRQFMQDRSGAGHASSSLDKRGSSAPGPRATGKPGATGAAPARGPTLARATSPVIHLEYVKAPVIPRLPPGSSDLSVEGLRSLRDELEGTLDRLNKMTEAIALQIALIMERRSKFIATLSQILKNIGTTPEGIIQDSK